MSAHLDSSTVPPLKINTVNNSEIAQWENLASDTKTYYLNTKVTKSNVNYVLSDYGDTVSINICRLHSKNSMALKLRQQKMLCGFSIFYCYSSAISSAKSID